MINFHVNGDKTNIKSEYDYETYQEIKKVNDAIYNMDDDTWTIDTSYLKHLVKQLNNMNKDISDAIVKLRDITEHQQYTSEELDIPIKTIRIKIVKENPKSLVIGFDYDPTVLEIIKQIEGRSYVKKEKSWRINKGNEDWLYTKLDELGYVELSDLKSCTTHNSQPEISLTKDEFPHSTITPYNFQMDALNQLLNQKKVINALEAGLGKTPITVMACEYLQKQTLIITPATVKRNWVKEIHKINPYADVTVLEAQDEWKDSQYIIMNYDIIGNFIENINNSNIGIVAFDEAHKLRGVNGKGEPTSQRAKYCVRIAEHMEYVFPITATPYINQTKDIFNLLTVIDHPSTDNWYMFANTYCGAEKGDFGTSYNGSSNQERLNSRLYPNHVIRMKTEDHIDLPDRVRNFIPVNINMKKYHKAVDDYMKKRGTLETNGQHLVYLNIMRKELAMAKAKESVNMVKDKLEQNQSVVIFTNFTDVADFLSNKFKTNSVKITGEVNSKDRQKAVDDFQEGKRKVFIGNIDAAGEGITLTKSHHMIVVDFHWSPVTMVNQMEKRIHRISQTQPSVIDYLYVEDAKMDKLFLSMLEEKLNDSSMIIDGKKEDFFTDKVIDKL